MLISLSVSDPDGTGQGRSLAPALALASELGVPGWLRVRDGASLVWAGLGE
jgi:hypothetical protein